MAMISPVYYFSKTNRLYDYGGSIMISLFYLFIYYAAEPLFSSQLFFFMMFMVYYDKYGGFFCTYTIDLESQSKCVDKCFCIPSKFHVYVGKMLELILMPNQNI